MVREREKEILKERRHQSPFDPSVASLCHPWFTTTNLSYRLPIFETSATALCGTTGIIASRYLYIALLLTLHFWGLHSICCTAQGFENWMISKAVTWRSNDRCALWCFSVGGYLYEPLTSPTRTAWIIWLGSWTVKDIPLLCRCFSLQTTRFYRWTMFSFLGVQVSCWTNSQELDKIVKT